MQATTLSQAPAGQPNFMPPAMQMMQMITGCWVSQSIYAAARLGIADQLKTGPKSYTELATLTGSHAPSVYRLMRALASVGIFAETEGGIFTLTPLSHCLRSDVPESIRDVSIMMGDPEHYGSWGNILHSVQTGQSGFENIYGKNVFAYYAENPEPAAVFDRAMASFSSIETAAVVNEFDFSGIEILVDVAGGQGGLLLAILAANPTLQGILFDQPDVIDRAKSFVAAQPASSRCQLSAGNFFESVPQGADAYMLKHIIHDWDDPRSIAILKRCHEAMTENGRVLLVEQVIPPGNAPFLGKLLDVNMLVMCPGGKERTADEYRDLLTAAGFRLTRIVPTAGLVSVIEGIRG